MTVKKKKKATFPFHAKGGGEDRDFTPKQWRFIKEYMTNGNKGGLAAMAAGYSPKIANKMASINLRQSNIRQYLRDKMARLEDDLGITVEWKASLLKRCAEYCIPSEDGKQMIPNGGIAAIAELNKMQGHYLSKDDEESDKMDEEILFVRSIVTEERKQLTSPSVASKDDK